MIGHLGNTRGIKLERLMEFSDGAGSQYKSINAFSQMNSAAKDNGLEICCSFFGSEHGKSESDGETGVIKTTLRNHILEDPDANISTARDIVNFGNAHIGTATFSSLSSYFRII